MSCSKMRQYVRIKLVNWIEKLIIGMALKAGCVEDGAAKEQQ